MDFKSLFKGLYFILSHILKKNITFEYPYQKPELNKYFRGKHSLNNCIACGLCKKVCPSDAITISKNDGIIKEYYIDYTKCIFCGNCVYYCPRHAIRMTTYFELACLDKSNLINKLIGA